MKKLVALLLALCCLFSCACAKEDWYVETAQTLARRMALLSGNLTYAAFFYDVKQDDVEQQLSEMAALHGKALRSVQVLSYKPEQVEAYIADYFVSDRVDENNAAVAEELLHRMNLSLPDMLNHLVGGWQWQALSRIMQAEATFEMPENFRQCALVLDYGTDVSILVTFTQTGETTATAQGSYIRTDVLEDEAAAPFLALLWEKE